MNIIDTTLLALGLLVVIIDTILMKQRPHKAMKTRKYMGLLCCGMVYAFGFPMEAQASEDLHPISFECYRLGAQGTKPDAIVILTEEQSSVVLPHDILRVQSAFTESLPHTVVFQGKENQTAIFDLHTRIMSVKDSAFIANYYCND